ncbi:hypothetical protein HDF18_17260 [Mucilaginibacter sp. X5P1]|uniref:hypothetical protein n=1 Tax=Mucilaginibacter sp. X5P1 TaxID=2723088 RepID=UPI00160C93FC|nr:hypothetical protein [Mucilaginibacter sp. X5P1]MBB6139384.1 hypothetical protein [Mucilaginibacter sp. X5P1]
MKLRIFKSTMAALAVVLLAAGTCFAQSISIQEDSVITIAPLVSPVPAVSTVTPISAQPRPVTKVKTKSLTVTVSNLTSQVKGLTAQINAQTMVAVNGLKVDIDGLTPAITTGFKAMGDGSSYNDNSKHDDNPLTKNYSKTYPVDANDALSIENRYGNVTVNTWAKSEIKVDVQIKVSSSNDNETQKILDNVTISDDKSGNTVSFKTNIGQPNNSWISWMSGGHSGRKIQIDYIVYMPSKNELTIDNRYGSIVLPDLQGKVTINCAYGSFAAKSLTNESAIRVKYGSASIENLGSSALDVSYGSLSLGSADKLLADVSYSGADIGKLKTSGAINIRYGGGLKIGGIEKTVKNLAINASYTGVSIGLRGDENANFDVTVHYGDFNYNEHNVTITGKSPADGDKGVHFTKSFKGYIGKGDAEKTIAINSSYASVKFE